MREKKKYKDKLGRFVDKYAVEDTEKHIAAMWGEHGTGHYTRGEAMYLSFFNKMFPQFEGGSVLEIGPGTGDFALSLLKRGSVSKYTVLDLAKNIKDSKALLSQGDFNVEFVESERYEELYDDHYDLFVAINCLSEVPDYYRENIGENILPHCKSLYMIDGDDEDPRFNKWMDSVLPKNFQRIVSEPSGYYTCLAISAFKE